MLVLNIQPAPCGPGVRRYEAEGEGAVAFGAGGGDGATRVRASGGQCAGLHPGPGFSFGRHPQVMAGLEPKPELCRISEVSSKAQSRVGSNAPFSMDEI